MAFDSQVCICGLTPPIYYPAKILLVLPESEVLRNKLKADMKLVKTGLCQLLFRRLAGSQVQPSILVPFLCLSLILVLDVSIGLNHNAQRNRARPLYCIVYNVNKKNK